MKEEKKEEIKKDIKDDANTKEESTAVKTEEKKEKKEKRPKVVERKEKSILDRKRKYTGVVFSKKNEKTIKVQVEKWQIHPLYKKRIKLNKSMMVHDRKNEANIGDKVMIVESRPVSKMKRWQLLKIVEKAK